MWSRTRRLGFLLLVLSPAISQLSRTQSEPKAPTCGRTKAFLGSPDYLITPGGIIIAAEPPYGWSLDKTRKNPFYFLKGADKYETARTLMYINVQRLEVPFDRAVRNDEEQYRQACQPARIVDMPQPEILERGCEHLAQTFYCEKQHGSYVDLVTKIAVGGLLINVVLSADNEAEIARYRNDYSFLLLHLGLVN